MSAGRRSRAVALALAAALPILLWPSLGAPLDGSFDSSWRWGVNVAAERNLPAGLLPSGPLGGWIEPRATGGGTLAAAARFQILLRAVWFAALAALALARPAPGRWLGLAALWLGGAFVAGRWPDHELVLLILVLVVPWAAAPADGSRGRLRLFVAAALAGLAPWLKLSGGLAALGALGGALLARGLRTPRQAGSTIAGAAALAALAAATGAAVAFDSFAALGRWLSAAPGILAGYGATMALDLGPEAHLAALAPIAACAAAGAFAAARRTRLGTLWLAAALPLAAALKHAIVRTDVHALAAPALGVGVLGLAVLLAESRREALLAGVLGLLALAAAVPHARSLGSLEPRRLAALVAGAEGGRGLVATLGWQRREASLRRSGAARLRPFRAPRFERLADLEGGVDVVPWRLTLLEANGLAAAWRPSPSFQLYQASTPALEARSAAHFASPAAPRLLIAHFDPLEGRQPLWEAPRVWRTLAERYAPPTAAVAGGGPLLLERRSRSRAWQVREIGSGELRWGTWHDLPVVAAGETLFAEIELRPTPLGRLRRALVRAEPVWLDLGGRGPIRRWRLVPELARFGLAVGETPRDLGGLGSWLAGAPERTGTRCRLRSADAGRYRPVAVRWSARRLADAAD